MLGAMVPPMLGGETFDIPQAAPGGITVLEPAATSYAMRFGGPILYPWQSTKEANGSAGQAFSMAVIRTPQADLSTQSLADPIVVIVDGSVLGRGGDGADGGGQDGGAGVRYSGGGGGGGAGTPGGAGGAGWNDADDGNVGGAEFGGLGGSGTSNQGGTVAPGVPEDGVDAMVFGFLGPNQRPDTVLLTIRGKVWSGGGGSRGGISQAQQNGLTGGDAGEDAFDGGVAGNAIDANGATLEIYEGNADPFVKGPIEP